MAVDGVQGGGGREELAVAQGEVQKEHLEAPRLLWQPDCRSEAEASGGRRWRQGQGWEEEELELRCQRKLPKSAKWVTRRTAVFQNAKTCG